MQPVLQLYKAVLPKKTSACLSISYYNNIMAGRLLICRCPSIAAGSGKIINIEKKIINAVELFGNFAAH